MDLKKNGYAGELTLEERIEAIENQFYIAYLQINSIAKSLDEKEIVTQDEVHENMETLNKEIYRVTNELIEKAKADSEVAAVDPEQKA